jgi:osmotically-inducible protein OsmY
MICAQPSRRTTNNRKPRNVYRKEIEMSGLKAIYTVALASALAGIIAGCADMRPGGTQSAVPDAQITADTQARLDQMADLGPPGSIRVQTLDKVVYLTGVVDGGLAKRNAEAAVRQVPGVNQVVDDIDVAHK